MCKHKYFEAAAPNLYVLLHFFRKAWYGVVAHSFLSILVLTVLCGLYTPQSPQSRDPSMPVLGVLIVTPHCEHSSLLLFCPMQLSNSASDFSVHLASEPLKARTAPSP